jgi:hypothetical protein
MTIKCTLNAKFHQNLFSSLKGYPSEWKSFTIPSGTHFVQAIHNNILKMVAIGGGVQQKHHFLLSTILYSCESRAYYLSQLVFLLAEGHFQQEQQL